MAPRCGSVVGLFCVVLAQQAQAAAGPWREPPPRARSVQARTLPDFSKLAQTAMGAVVSISTLQPGEAAGEDPIKKLMEPAREEPQKGLGSGFFIHPAGYVLSNAHVVEGATSITVSVQRHGRMLEYPARLVGTDNLSDVALLKVDADGPFETLALGDSDKLTVAEWVVAIGNPYGLSHSVTVGVVSFIGRTDVMPTGRDGYYDYIQTDASINPGNSGGPLMNARGEVVGIANAVNAVGQGIGFAIPINIAKEVLAALYSKGQMRRSYLGISVQELTPEIARFLSLPPMLEGVVVSEVVEGAPGEAAGVKVGDIVTAFNGAPMADPHRMRWLAAIAGVGKKVPLLVRRSGTTLKLVATLGEAPREPPSATISQPAELGVLVREVDMSTARSAGLALPLGARVCEVRPESLGEQAGLRNGDVILKVDDFSIRGPEHLSKALRRLSGGAMARMIVRRGGETVFLTFAKPESREPSSDAVKVRAPPPPPGR